MKCKKCDFVIELRRQQNGQFAVSGSLDLGHPFSENPRPLAEPPAVQQRPMPPRPSPLTARLNPMATAQASKAAAQQSPLISSGPAETEALAGFFKQSLAEQDEAALPPSDDVVDEWFVGLNKAPVGPLTTEELRERIVAGEVSATTLAWRDGFEEWRPVKSFPELEALLAEAPVKATVVEAPKEEPPRVVQIEAQPERPSWVVAKPTSKFPRAIFFTVAILLAGTIGFVINKPKTIVQYVDRPVSAPAQAAPEVVTPPAQKAIEPVDIAAAPASATPTAPAQNTPKVVGSSEPSPGNEPKAPAAPSGGLLAGLSGLQGGPPGVAGPQASHSEAVAGGAQLDADGVQRTVQRYSQSVRRSCWQPALDGRAADAPSAARVMMTITVTASGDVQDASSDGDAKGYPGLARCIESRVKQWHFPASGGTTTVKVPFVFAAQ